MPDQYGYRTIGDPTPTDPEELKRDYMHQQSDDTGPPSTLADRLNAICTHDLHYLITRDADYGSSWLRRGGIGAYLTAVRPIDRLDAQLAAGTPPWDILANAHANPLVLNAIRDARRYLLLIEAELLRRHPDLPVDDPKTP